MREHIRGVGSAIEVPLLLLMLGTAGIGTHAAADLAADTMAVRSILGAAGMDTVPLESVVGIRDGRITRLSLTGVALGIFELADDALPYLDTLWLINCALDGLPQSVAGLSRLTTLGLSQNELSAFPEVVTELANLRHLGLEACNLHTVAPELTRLSKLTVLRLGGNTFAEFPDVLTELRSLRELRMGHTGLQVLPPTIGRLDSLQVLSLNANDLVSLPESVGNLRALLSLDVAFNELTSVPATLGRLASLRVLRLEGNRLTDLPDEVLTLSNVGSLGLYSNFFCLDPRQEVVAWADPREDYLLDDWKNMQKCTGTIGLRRISAGGDGTPVKGRLHDLLGRQLSSGQSPGAVTVRLHLGGPPVTNLRHGKQRTLSH